MTAQKVTRVWTEKPPEEKGVVPFIAREGLPLWKAMRQQGNDLIDDVSTKAGSIVNWLFGGNTTGQSSSSALTLPALAVVAMGALSGGLSAGSIVLSAPPQSAQTLGAYAVSNTTGQSSSTTIDARSLSLAGLGAVSVGYSAGSAVISAPLQTNQTIGAFFSGTTTGQSSSSTIDARSLSFSAVGGGISAGMSAGQIVLSVAAPVAQSNQTLGFLAVGNTFSTSTSTTLDARTISLRGTLGASVGYSAGSIIIAAPTTAAQTNQTLSWSAAGNTFSGNNMTVDARSLLISGAGGASVGVSNGTIAISAPVSTGIAFAFGNTTINGTGSITPVALTISGLGGVSVGWSQSSILVISGGAGGGGGIALAAGTQTATSGTVVFSNSNGVSFGMSNSSIVTASVGSGATATGNLGGIAAGTQTGTSGTIVFLNSNGVTFGMSGSTQVTASVGGIGTQSIWAPGFPGAGSSSNAASWGNGTVIVVPTPIQGNVSFSRGDIYASLSVSSSSNSSHAGVISVFVGIYTRNASTLSLASSGSQSHQWTNTSNNSLGSISGVRRLSVPINANMTPGDYWLAILTRSSTTNANWFSASNFYWSQGISNGLTGLIGEASNGSKQLAPGWGFFSATSTALPGSMAFSAISGHGQTGSSLGMIYPVAHFYNYTV